MNKIANLTTFCSGQYHRTAPLAAKLFDIIGQHAEASYARSLAEEIKANIRKYMVDFDTMTVIGNCQTSQALAMYAGIFNDDEYEEAGRRLMQIIKEDKEINTCGVIGLRFIYHVLADIGEVDTAYKLITSTERSCYGAWVKAGATTMWESFPYEDGRGMNSQNHHFLGDISNFFISDIVGIRPNPNLNDIAEFEIAPHFVSDLDYARAYFKSDFGNLKAEWRRENGGIILDLSVPDGMHGYLKLSDNFKSDFADKVLNGGNYCIKITEV